MGSKPIRGTNPLLSAIGPEPVHQIDISIDEPYLSRFFCDWLRSVVQIGLAAAVRQEDPVQVSLLVTGDQVVQDLNLAYRGLDEVTDVLSFSTAHAGHWEGESPAPDGQFLSPGDDDEFPMPLPPGELPPLGEVVLSYPQAARQAEEHGVPLYREMSHLIIHGLLHLAGYDHEYPRDRETMENWEHAALEALEQQGNTNP